MQAYLSVTKSKFIQLNALLFWAIVTIGMLIYAMWIPVHPDEAYYWTWSQHLALSYFDGPPLTAWLLRLITALFGIHIWTLKFIAVASVSISALILYRLATLLFDYDVGLKTLIIFFFIPITQATNFVTSLDPLLMLFWSLALYLFWCWLEKPSISTSILLGITIGLGILAKYPMVLFFPCAFIFLLATTCRKYLLSYKPYLIFIIACLFTLPIIIWNQQHQWVSLSFQWHHGAEQAHHFTWKHVEMFFLGQLGAFNPIYFIALLIFSIRYFKDYKYQQTLFLLIPTILVLLIFGYFGLFNRSEANWTMPAYLSATILLAYFCDKHPFSITLWLGLILNILVILLLKFPYFTPHNLDNVNPVMKFYGYSETINPLVSTLTPEQTMLPIISDTYQDASEIAWNIQTHPNVCIVTPTRTSVITMRCRQFKKALSKKESSILWIGPKFQLPVIQKLMGNCKIIAASDYRYKTTHRNWVAAECNGKLNIN